jgi:hypothetical protein
MRSLLRVVNTLALVVYIVTALRTTKVAPRAMPLLQGETEL